MTEYERKQFENEIYVNLKEAKLEAKSSDERFSHEEVFMDLRAKIEMISKNELY